MLGRRRPVSPFVFVCAFLGPCVFSFLCSIWTFSSFVGQFLVSTVTCVCTKAALPAASASNPRECGKDFSVLGKGVPVFSLWLGILRTLAFLKTGWQVYVEKPGSRAQALQAHSSTPVSQSANLLQASPPGSTSRRPAKLPSAPAFAVQPTSAPGSPLGFFSPKKLRVLKRDVSTWLLQPRKG